MRKKEKNIHEMSTEENLIKFLKLKKVRKGSDIHISLLTLLERGRCNCGYSYGGSWPKKKIWTNEAFELANEFFKPTSDQFIIMGNDAPRGGASGEFVKLSENFSRILKIQKFI